MLSIFWGIIAFCIFFAVVGWIIWIVFFVWLAKIALQNTEKNFIQMMRQVEGMLNNSHSNFKQLTPQQKNQSLQMLNQIQRNMWELDDLSRRRYETKISDLMGKASEVGVYWNPYQ